MPIFADLVSNLNECTELLQLAIEQDDLEQALLLAERRNNLIDELAVFATQQSFKEEVSLLAKRLALIDDKICEYINNEKNEVEHKLITLNNTSAAIKKYTNYSQG